MCGAIEEVIPPCGTIPPSLFLICIAVCVMSRSFIVTGSVLWMPSLVSREREREREGWIYFSRSVVYLSLSTVAAVHYRKRCVCECVINVCVCVFVFGSSCKSELGQDSIDVQQQGC